MRVVRRTIRITNGRYCDIKSNSPIISSVISNVRTKKENFYVKNTSCSGNEGILGTALTTDMCKTIYLKKADC